MQVSAPDKAGVIVAPAVRDLAILATALTGWLAGRMPQAGDIRLSNLAYPRGAGQSHETILLDADWREGGMARSLGMAVRIKPTSHTVFQDDMFVEQYRLMAALHAGGYVPVARPLWIEDDPTVLGASFFVMEKVVGRVAVSIPSYMKEGWVVAATPAQRARLWESGVRNLAALQQVPLTSVDFLDRPSDGQTGFDQEWSRWRRYLSWVGETHDLTFHERAYEKLRATLPANRPEGLVWGDARLGNVMVDDDFQVVAVMDLEQPSLGGALQDLGWWLSHEQTLSATLPGGRPLPGFGSREDTIALWREVTGISTTDIEWYEAFANFKRASLLVRLTGLKGHAPTDGDYTVFPIVRQLGERLGII